LARCLKADSSWNTRLVKADQLPDAAPGLSAQLSAAFGWALPTAIPWAAILASDEDINLGTQRWLALEALSLRVAPNGVYVVASNDFGQSHAEMSALWDAIQSLLEEEGFTLHRGRGQRAYLQLTDSHSDPDTLSAEDLLGLELTPWFPQQRDWRRRLNEFQIVWAQHPVNQQRLASGQMPINSPWFGRSAVHTTPPSARPSGFFSADPLLQALAKWAAVPQLSTAAEPTRGAVLDLREDPVRAYSQVLHNSHRQQHLNFSCGARFVLRPWHRWRFWRTHLLSSS
jgi:hypothetical protein